MTGYVVESRLVTERDGGHLDLATALAQTPDGSRSHPVFFQGMLTRPDVAAAGLLAVADVAASRYADAGLGARLANLDPVVTAGGDRLRFESFSDCNGVHARFDLLRDGLGSSEVGNGTTNVDINPGLRTALARIGRAEPLHLSVGRDELRVSTPDQHHVERKVRLPERWIRGLAEVPALARGMQIKGELVGPRIVRFLASLPRVAPPGPSLHVLPTPSGWRLAQRPVPGAIPLPGASRLRGLDRLARHATQLTAHAGPNGTTAWVLDLPGSRFTLVVSPDPYRGFSGEGTLLAMLTNDDAEGVGRRILPALDWSPVIDATALAAQIKATAPQTEAGLAWLSASGRLGWDLTEQAWFHRELPIDSEKIVRRHPRLVAARQLLERDAVKEADAGWQVTGSHGYVYQLTRELHCGCTWHYNHGDSRGPCKHALAVILTLRGTMAE